MPQVTGTYTFEVDEDRVDELVERARQLDVANLGREDGPYSLAKAFDVVFRLDGLDWLRRERVVTGWGWSGDDALVDDQGGSAL